MGTDLKTANNSEQYNEFHNKDLFEEDSSEIHSDFSINIKIHKFVMFGLMD